MVDERNKDASPQTDHTARPGQKSRQYKRREEEAKEHDHLDDALERGLEDTFPASDPVSIIQPPHSPCDKYAAIERQRSSAIWRYPLDSAGVYDE